MAAPPAGSAGAEEGKLRIGWRMLGTVVLGLGLNLLLALFKLAAGILGRAAAMIADAGHSLGDLAGDFVTLWALRAAEKPPDDDHPFGHGKYESVGALSVAAGAAKSGPTNVGVGSFTATLSSGT